MWEFEKGRIYHRWFTEESMGDEIPAGMLKDMRVIPNINMAKYNAKKQENRDAHRAVDKHTLVKFEPESEVDPRMHFVVFWNSLVEWVNEHSLHIVVLGLVLRNAEYCSPTVMKAMSREKTLNTSNPSWTQPHSDDLEQVVRWIEFFVVFYIKRFCRGIVRNARDEIKQLQVSALTWQAVLEAYRQMKPLLQKLTTQERRWDSLIDALQVAAYACKSAVMSERQKFGSDLRREINTQRSTRLNDNKYMVALSTATTAEARAEAEGNLLEDIVEVLTVQEAKDADKLARAEARAPPTAATTAPTRVSKAVRMATFTSTDQDVDDEVTTWEQQLAEARLEAEVQKSLRINEEQEEVMRDEEGWLTNMVMNHKFEFRAQDVREANPAVAKAIEQDGL